MAPALGKMFKVGATYKPVTSKFSLEEDILAD